MEVPFNTLPETARIWVYQADRLFTNEEQAIISTTLSSFIKQWTAHGSELKASFTLPHNHFIVIGLDQSEASASGCSIDGLFRLLQQLAAQTGIDFLNRERIAFKRESGIELIYKQQLKEKITSWGGSVLTFNNVVATKQEFETQWLIPVESMWLKKYLPHVSA
jgi:hypothetical protein